MKTRSNKKIKKATTAILVLLWAALSLVNSIIYPSSVAENLENEVEQSIPGEEKQQDHIVFAYNEAVQTSLSINVCFQSFLLDIINAEEPEEQKESIEDTFYQYSCKKIKVLFQKIISKNAP